MAQENSSDSTTTQELHRSINTRQLGMIAIGGAIGTGLFFASGGAIAQAGPGGALLAYAVMGLAVFCMMQSLGEMATQLPIRGSFEAYAERFIDPSLAFAVGWNYWFSWSVTLAAELVAGALIVQFWFPHSNSSLCAMGFFAIVMILNLMSVRAYAEAEYWFAGIKVVTVIIFIGVGILMIAGMIGGDHPGFRNWTLMPIRMRRLWEGGPPRSRFTWSPAFRFRAPKASALPRLKPPIPARTYPGRFAPCSGEFYCSTLDPFLSSER
jgi:lysine-specific permease